MVLGLVVLVGCLAVAFWRAGGGQWFIIETPSMGRAAPVGTLIFTEPVTVAQLHVGDLITYRPPPARWEIYTHRIVSISGDIVRTQGDVNGAVDPWSLRGGDILGRVAVRWWGIGWLVRGLPLLAVGWVLTALVSRYWVRVEHRLAFRLLAGSIVFSVVGLIVRPFVRFVEITATAEPNGVKATLVSTGILPIQITSNGANLNLVAGQVGSLTSRPQTAESGIHLLAHPYMSWQWWVICVVLATSPILWVLIIGAAPLDHQPPPPSRPVHPVPLAPLRMYRRRLAAATVLIVLGASGLLTASTRSAFAAVVLGPSNTAGSNLYFTCSGAEPGIAPHQAYFVWPMAEAGTTLPAMDISGHNRPGTYSGTLAPDPQVQPCARDASDAMTFGTNGVAASNTPITTAPDTFTESIWFQTLRGGRLIGLGNSPASTSTVYDRQIWIDDTGHVVFGIHNATYHQAVSPLSYNDNKWHQATASLSSAGMALYVDGALVATNPATTGTAFAPAPFINLGSAASYAAVGSAVTSTGSTVLNGDLGVTATATSTGFPPGVVNGQTHIQDTAAAQAKADTQTANNQVAALTPTGYFAGDQNGSTFSPGVYQTGSAFALTGTMTLDARGDPNAVFVFQIEAAMNTAAASRVVLANGAQAGNVYWQAVGAVGTGANSAMVGTLLGRAAMTLGADSTLTGRALAVGANTLASNTVNVPPVPANAGYFRVGYDNMLDVPNRPSNSSFAGDLAFAAVYLTALTDAQIKTVYIAGT